MARKKSPVKKKTSPSRVGGKKRSAQAETVAKKKTVAKKGISAAGKEAAASAEGPKSLLKKFKEKKRAKSLFSLETREDLEGKKVAELRTIAREAGFTLKARRKVELAEELAGGLGLFPKVRRKSPAKVTKPSPATKKPAPAKKRVISPARPILKKKPAAKAKEQETALPGVPEVVVRLKEDQEPLVEKALGEVLKEETGLEGMDEISFREEPAREKPAREVAEAKPRDIDRVAAIAVDPHTVFVDWDISKRTAEGGRPLMRVYDITGVEFDGTNYRAFEDIELTSRSGESFIEARPGREYVVDAGVVDSGGRFMPARRTSKVTTPPEEPSEGPSVLPDEYFRPRPGDYGHR